MTRARHSAAPEPRRVAKHPIVKPPISRDQLEYDSVTHNGNPTHTPERRCRPTRDREAQDPERNAKEESGIRITLAGDAPVGDRLDRGQQADDNTQD